MAPREGVVVGHRTAAVLVELSLARACLAAACLARVDGLRPGDVSKILLLLQLLLEFYSNYFLKMTR